MLSIGKLLQILIERIQSSIRISVFILNLCSSKGQRILSIFSKWVFPPALLLPHIRPGVLFYIYCF